MRSPRFTSKRPVQLARRSGWNVNQPGLGEADPTGPERNLLPALFRVPTGERGLAIATDEQFQLVLAGTTDAESLQDLRNGFVALQAVAAKSKLVFDDLIRLAIQRLEVERKLGVLLSQTGHRGRPTKRSPDATFSKSGAASVREDASKQEQAKYRKLAAITDELFEAYLETARFQRRLPTSAGARRFASSPKPKAASKRPPRSRGPGAAVPERVIDAACLIPAAVLDAVETCLGDIGVLVGQADMLAATRLEPTSAVPKDIRGTVFVAECRDPEVWLPTLVRLRTKAAISDVVIVLPADPGAKWFRHLADGWCCCFMPGEQPVMIAHHGLHAHAFELTMMEHGVVLRAFSR